MALDIFDQIAGAQVTGGGYPYIDGKEAPTGNYILEINTFKKRVGAVDGLDKFIAELKVVESDIPERPVGSYVQFVKIPAKHKFPGIVIGELKEFIAAAAKMHVNDLTRRDILDSVGEENPLRGVKVRARVYHKETKTPGKSVTVTDFSIA